MSLPNFKGSGKDFSKFTSKLKGDMPLVKEMQRIGLDNNSILTIGTAGVVIWAVLIWLFADRIMRVQDSADEEGSNPADSVRNITVIILVLHLLTGVFIYLEGYQLSRNIFLTWIIVAMALVATLFNTAVLGHSLYASSYKNSSTGGFYYSYDNVDLSRDAISVALQCIATGLMFAYLIHLIRNKRKTMY